MKSRESSTLARRVVAAASLAILIAAPADADIITWTGFFNDAWDNTNNWQSLALPGSGDIAKFQNFAGGEVKLNGNRTIQSLVFGGGVSYVLAPTVSTDTLTLLAGDILVTTSVVTHAINSDLVISNNGEWLVDSSIATLEINGRLTGNNISTTGSGTVRLTGGNSESGPSSVNKILHQGGDLDIDGATIEITAPVNTEAMTIENGDVIIQGGADVVVTDGNVLANDNSMLTITGSGTVLTGPRVDVANHTADTASILIEENCQLDLSSALITGVRGDGQLTMRSGAGVVAGTFAVALIAGSTGNAMIQDGATVACGTMSLSGQSGSAGGLATLTVDSGASVQVSGQTQFGSSDVSLVVDGGMYETDTLVSGSGVVTTVSISDPATASALTVGTNDGDSTIESVIQDAAGGPGSVVKIGAGRLTLDGSNTYSGGTFLDGGILELTTDGNLGDPAGPLTFNGGTLMGNTTLLNVSINLASTRPVTIDNGGGTFWPQPSRTITVPAPIDGNGVLTKTGSGPLFLTGDSTYTGGTTIDGGVLHLGTGGTSGSVVGDIVNDASLQFNRSDNRIFAGVISGTGDVTKTGGGTLFLTGDSTYTGGTTIDGGVLVIGFAGTSGSVVGDIVNEASLWFSRSDAHTFAGVISGTGSLTKNGVGTLTLTGASTYSGGTTLIDGATKVNNSTGSATGTGPVEINDGAQLGGSGFVTGPVTAHDGATISPGLSIVADSLNVGEVTFESGSIMGAGLAGVPVFDRLIVSGAATINAGSTLDMSYFGSFTADPGDSFLILQATTLSGTFDNVNFPDGQNWSIEYDTNAGTVTVGICEDDDGDGVCNADDICPGFDDNVDTDTDGVPDGCDICPGFDDNVDADADGVPDGCDICPGSDDNVDTDTDGVPDGCDICPGFDDNVDTDTDGVPDGCDLCPGFDDNVDTDGDSVPDGCDICPGFDDNVDTDADGIPDGCDACPSSPNVHNTTQGTFHPTIQDAVSAAVAGDVIELGACTFVERGIVLNNRDITIRGQGSDLTIIDGAGVTGKILKFQGGDSSTIEDLTLRNGVADTPNGGAAVDVASDSTPVFRRCRFENNDAGGFTFGAVYLESNSVSEFYECVFTGNTSAGLASTVALERAGTSGKFVNCLFNGNSGAARSIHCMDGAMDFVNCTFADTLDGVTMSAAASGGTISLVNCVLDATSSFGTGTTAVDSLFSGATGDNIDGVPTFENPNAADYRLAAGSLGIDAADHDAYVAAGGGGTDLGGDPRTADDAGTVDTGSGAALTYLDMGAYEFQGVTDTDGDGVPDAFDICPGFDDNVDTDGDGVPDGCDICPGSDDTVDTDADGIPDGCDACSDVNVQNVTQGTVHGTIQDALTAANAGDVIELGACTFFEDSIAFPDSVDLTLRGAGRDLTIIDGSGANSILDIRNTGQTSATLISDLTLRNGAAGSGGPGALDIKNTSPEFRDVNFLDNAGPGAGVGQAHVRVRGAAASPLFRRCVFSGGSNADTAFAAFAGTTTLLQCLFADNATSKAVRFVTGTVMNCTVTAMGTTSGKALLTVGGVIDAHNSVFEGTLEANSGGVINTTRCLYSGATGDNIDGVPTFENPNAADYRLAAGSLGIDAADHDAYIAGGGGGTDLGGDPRTADDAGTVDTGSGAALTYLDMGAYEFQGTTVDCPGDTDGDGDTDLTDLAILLAHFGSSVPIGTLGDLDSSGVVDLTDLAIQLADFGCTP